ncbi:hypothetical protein RHSIM_Rhsim02G0143100 [Rhododendron simsii]|uniref:Myb/SANT-like DNA-binding domain-containing protein n=1 Tax=Rhododendron simsii TaxID=118357 RepID=A0A834LSA9_RHOSS|nr:hypothetical protein RHSIM_Rhsim02G0143100 [Rhododendron simsii]
MGELVESVTPQTAPLSRTLPFREDCWSEEATSTLVDAWGRRYLDLNRGNLRQKDWQEVADAVNARHGHTKKTRRTDVQCKNRIDTLKKKYKVEKARVSDSDGAVPSPWPFFDRLDVLIGPAAAGKKVSPSPPLALPLPYRKPAPVAVVLPQKRPALGSARAIERFGDIYQRVEGEKQRQMIELEKQRMQFAKDLEVQRMQLFMDTQVQLEKIKQAKRSSSNVLDVVEVVYIDISYCGTEVSSMPFLLEVMLNPIPKSSLSLHHRLCISRGVWLEGGIRYIYNTVNGVLDMCPNVGYIIISRGRTFDEILTSDVEQWLLVVGWICCLTCLLNDMYVALDCLAKYTKFRLVLLLEDVEKVNGIGKLSVYKAVEEPDSHQQQLGVKICHGKTNPGAKDNGEFDWVRSTCEGYEMVERSREIGDPFVRVEIDGLPITHRPGNVAADEISVVDEALPSLRGRSARPDMKNARAGAIFWGRGQSQGRGWGQDQGRGRDQGRVTGRGADVELQNEVRNDPLGVQSGARGEDQEVNGRAANASQVGVANAHPEILVGLNFMKEMLSAMQRIAQNQVLAVDTKASITMREFQRHGPPIYNGDPDPIAANEWLELVTRFLDTLHVKDDDLRVDLAAFQLRENAHQW